MNPANATAQTSTGHQTFKAKTVPITDEYLIGKNVLGLGISGKVVECFSKKANHKYALKVWSYSCICSLLCGGFV